MYRRGQYNLCISTRGVSAPSTFADCMSPLPVHNLFLSSAHSVSGVSAVITDLRGDGSDSEWSVGVTLASDCLIIILLPRRIVQTTTWARWHDLVIYSGSANKSARAGVSSVRGLVFVS